MKYLLSVFIAFLISGSMYATEDVSWKWNYTDVDDAFIDLVDDNASGFMETSTPNLYAGKLMVELPDGMKFKMNEQPVFVFKNSADSEMFQVDMESRKAILSLKHPNMETVPSPVELRLNPKSVKGKFIKGMTTEYVINFGSSDVKTVFKSPVTGRVYHLVFNDEFNDGKIDAVKWDTRSNHSPFTRRGMYKGEPYYVLCHDEWTKELDGKLRLEVSKYPTQKSVVMTGGVLSLDRFMTKYGYYETKVSFKDCIGEGYWPAFWLMFDGKDKYGDGTEIDIFEYIPKDKQIFHTLHWYKQNSTLGNRDGVQHAALNYDKNKKENEHRSSTKYFELADAGSMEHTFAVEWTPDELIFYTDGKVTRHVKKSAEKGEIPHAYQMVYFSCSAGEWGGNVMNNNLPAYVYFDYCRCYQEDGQDAIYTLNGVEKMMTVEERKGKL